jgi:hypothetical protein
MNQLPVTLEHWISVVGKDHVSLTSTAARRIA